MLIALDMSKSEKEDSDQFLKEKMFISSGDLDLSKFLEDARIEDSKENQNVQLEIIDEAIGQINEPFVFSESEKSNDLNEDYSNRKPTDSIVTQIAKEGENRIHWALMITMISVYSAIGLIIGIILNPLIALFGLLFLSILGFWLGGKWIPKNDMNVLGVTWVIISMKLLYGLALDLHHWGWLDDFNINEDIILGLILLILVCLNIFIANWHNSDAIAVQATLILMVVASGASATSSEIGIDSGILLASLLLMATLLLHGLAIQRKSGNLAAMGIVASNLWIGIHALSDNWMIFNLVLIKLEDALLLFILFSTVNITNAIIATKFYKENNWFSQASKVLGIGKPGLWGVSVSIGMIGALMTIAANRYETGYALAQISMLLASFGGSYLVVRGVKSSKLQASLYFPGILLIVSLFIIESLFPEGLISGLANYSLFSFGSTLVISFTLLNNQTAVSDTVLWTGGVAIVTLLTILIPTNRNSDEGLRLLIGISIVFGGLAILSVFRKSPSLGGVALLGPWIWCLFFATSVDQRLIKSELIPIDLNPWYLTVFCIVTVTLQYPVNKKLGHSSLNIGSKLEGITEFSAFTRDSGILKLWNLSLILSLTGWMAITYYGGMYAEGLFVGLIVLFGIHLIAEIRSEHQNNPLFLMYACILVSLIFQFRFGYDAFWTVLITIFGLILSEFSNKDNEKIMVLLMSSTAASLILATLFPGKNTLEITIQWPESNLSVWVQLFCVFTILTRYIPRAGKFEHILQPAIANGIMLLSCIVLAANNSSWQLLISFIMLFFSSIILVMQTEVRSGLKDIARKEAKIEDIKRKQLIKKYLDSGKTLEDLNNLSKTNTENGSGNYSERGRIEVIDPELIELLEKRKKKRLNSKISENDLLLQDAYYRPIVMLLFISIIFLITGYFSYSPLFSNTGNLANSMLLIAAIFSVLIISASRWRTKDLELNMADILGIEMPVFISMCGISMVYLLGRFSSGATQENQMALLILIVVLCIFGVFAIWGKKDLGRRIPSAVELIVLCLGGSGLIGFFIFAATPPPFLINPLKFEALIYRLPLFTLEIILIILVLIWDKIDSTRLLKKMNDHRGPNGRIIWMLFIATVSNGLATITASILMIQKSLKWKQPSVISISNMILFIGFYVFISWINADLLILVSILGVTGATVSCCILLYISTLKQEFAGWVSCWSWDAHVIGLISIILLMYSSTEIGLIVLVLVLVGLSLSVWSTGILLDLRTYRVWGAVDLLVAWIIAILSVEILIRPSNLLTILGATGILLGIITWLAQSNKHILSGNNS